MVIFNKKIVGFKLFVGLKCPECKHRNVTQAKYCYSCGYRFKEDEINEASKHGLAVYIKMFFDWTSKFKFTDWKIWKIVSIIGILYTGINYVYVNGYKLKIEKSDNYTYEYNNKENEYYVYFNNEHSTLNLYVPHEIPKLYAIHYDEFGNILDTNQFDYNEDINLVIDNDDKSYYLITMNQNENKSNEYIKVLTYTNVLSEADNEEE